MILPLCGVATECPLDLPDVNVEETTKVDN